MTQVLELNGKLTPDELNQVKSFAEFLISRRSSGTPVAGAELGPKYVNVSALAGMCAGLGGNKTDVELAHEATEIRAAKFE